MTPETRAADQHWQTGWDSFVDRLEDDLSKAAHTVHIHAWKTAKQRLENGTRSGKEDWVDTAELQSILDETFGKILATGATQAANTTAKLLDIGLPFETGKWARLAQDRYRLLTTTTQDRTGWAHQVALDVSEAVTVGYQAGESTGQIAQRIADKLGITPGDLKAVGARSLVVARTEANGLANAISYQVMEDSGVVKLKRWYSIGDARTRGTHAAVNGQTVPFTSTFNVNGHAMRGPHDSTAPASETINCRCRLIPITK